jgi:hypothetical protein
LDHRVLLAAIFHLKPTSGATCRSRKKAAGAEEQLAMPKIAWRCRCCRSTRTRIGP